MKKNFDKTNCLLRKKRKNIVKLKESKDKYNVLSDHCIPGWFEMEKRIQIKAITVNHQERSRVKI